jgi:four helix bundle protein
LAKIHQLFLDIANDVELFPKKRVAWIIADQILRSSSSISANISEGFGRRSSADYIHFLVISRGSTTETQNWLIKCRDLGYITKTVVAERAGICNEILKMLNALIGSLQQKIS